MDEFELIPLSSASTWKEALYNIKHDFSHTWENCHAMYLTTGFNTYLSVFRSGDTRIVCPIAERTYKGSIDIVTPYGFSGFVGTHDFAGFQGHWKAFAQERGYVCGYIALNSLFYNSSYLNENDVHTYNTLYFINLTLSGDDLFKRLDRNRKRQVKNWPGNAEQYVTDKIVLKDFLLKNYHTFFSSKNASKGYLFSNETLSFIADQDNVFMVGMFQNGRIEALYVFAYTPYVAQSLFHISLQEGKSHTMQLLWYGINHLKGMGIPFLNLGGGIKEGDSIAQFKERMGADKLPLTCLKQVYNNTAFDMLCKEVNQDPTKTNEYFPPYRKP